jgi:metal-responsive CopG/Arc/MetJ family transcriptional regulator
MTTIKTAISLQKSLFEQVEKLAHQMKVSRSRLFTMALEDFIRRQENEALLEQINRSYDETTADDDLPSPDVVRHHMRRMSQDEW